MAISFSCGTCGKPYKVDERFAGKKAKCRGCGAINKIPGNEPHARPGLLEPLAPLDDDDAPASASPPPSNPTTASKSSTTNKASTPTPRAPPIRACEKSRAC